MAICRPMKRPTVNGSCPACAAQHAPYAPVNSANAGQHAEPTSARHTAHPPRRSRPRPSADSTKPQMCWCRGFYASPLMTMHPTPSPWAAIRDALDRAGLIAPKTVDVSVGPKDWEVVFDEIAGGSREESRRARGYVDADRQPHPRLGCLRC